MNNGLSNPAVVALAINGSNVFAGTLGGGVNLSTDNGGSWVPVNNGLSFPFFISNIFGRYLICRYSGRRSLQVIR